MTQDELTVLTKPKIIPVAIEWLRVEQQENVPTRYVVSGVVCPAQDLNTRTGTARHIRRLSLSKKLSSF